MFALKQNIGHVSFKGMPLYRFFFNHEVFIEVFNHEVFIEGIQLWVS